MRTRFGYTFILLIFLSIPFLHGCAAQSNTSIKGKVQLVPGWKPKMYLIRPQHFQEIAADYLGQVIDSAAINEDGNFSFKPIPNINDKTLLILVIQPEGSRYANHLIDDDPLKANYMPVIYTPAESIDITADVNSLQSSFSIKMTSKENLNLLSLRDIRQHTFEKYVGVSRELEEDSLLIEKEKAFSDYIAAMMAFADSTTVSDAAMIAIRWISPANDYERIPEFIYSQSQKWSALYPDNVFVKELYAAARKDKLPLMTGDMMPDVLLPLVTRDTVRLTTLLTHKLTLVDIWASWCAPCRKETREELLPLWNQYHDNGFQIVGYSIDANEGPWKKAIMKDGSKWIHASHLTGDATPFMDALRISTIPANYLLDANGKVLARNLHGMELSNFVERYLHR
ncbi:MAG TPA: TlpA disulfide reductase family protein [Saprospiraceae bacterium]|nr:TlpA disulfide reductase family protein [Saprospiraceae bacterium]